jgi:hypothetical protein
MISRAVRRVGARRSRRLEASVTRKLAISLFALIALTALLAAACSSGGDGDDDGQAAAADRQDEASVATVDDDSATPASDDDSTSGSGDATSSGGDTTSGSGDSTSSGGGTSGVGASGGEAVTVSRATSAAARTSELESYQFAMEFGMEGVPELPGTMVFTAEGAVDAANERVHMRLDMNSIFDVIPAGTSADDVALMRALMGDGIIEFLADGETVYLNWSLFTNLFGAETKWVSFTDDSGSALSGFSGGVSFEQFGTGPDAFLGYFTGIGSIEERGPAVSRGVATTHYVATLDLAKAIEESDPAQAEELRQQFAEMGVTALGTMPVEFWIDGDGFLRSFYMDFDFTQLGAGADVGAERMFISADFFNFGDAVQIPVPSPDEVTELDGSSLFGGGF